MNNSSYGCFQCYLCVTVVFIIMAFMILKLSMCTKILLKMHSLKCFINRRKLENCMKGQGSNKRILMKKQNIKLKYM